MKALPSRIIQARELQTVGQLLAGLTILLLSVSPVRAQDNDPPGSLGRQSAELQMLMQNEAKWRDTYKHELERPALSVIPDSTNYLPESLSGVMLGLSEDAFRSARPAAAESTFTIPAVREVFEFVPGIFSERFESGPWQNAHFRIHQRRLAAIILTSRPIVLLADVNMLTKRFCSKYLALAGKPAKMGVTLDIWGKANRGLLVWQKQGFSAIIARTITDAGNSVVSLVVVATPYYNDTMQHYLFADLPDGDVESFIRQTFPFLPEVSSLDESKKSDH